jgi:hypothetical protein
LFDSRPETFDLSEGHDKEKKELGVSPFQFGILTDLELAAV